MQYLFDGTTIVHESLTLCIFQGINSKYCTFHLEAKNSFQTSGYFVTLQIVVSTKSPKSDKQYVWEAEADSSSYLIKEETDPEKMLTRGTQITLFLRV